MVVPAEILSFLKALREQHPHLSKYKLGVFVDEWCRGKGLGFLDWQGDLPLPAFLSSEKTAVELKTRQAWGRLVPTVSSYHAKRFLLSLLTQLKFPLPTIPTDNGSEFHASFDAVVKELNLTHLWSPPRTPQVHSRIERFNGVFPDEFVNYHLDIAIADPQQFQRELETWLTWYNTRGPHHART